MSTTLYHDDRPAYPTGACPICGTAIQHRVCADCGAEGYILDCGHESQPRPIAAGMADGSDLHHCYCADCADAVEDLTADEEAGTAVAHPPAGARANP